MNSRMIRIAAATIAVTAGGAHAQDTSPSRDFEVFLQAFRENPKTQEAFTARPLESVTIDAEAMPEPAPVKEMLDGDKLKFPVMANAATQAKEGLQSQTTAVEEDMEFKLFVPDTGIQIRYLFRKRADGSCWELARMTDDTF